MRGWGLASALLLASGCGDQVVGAFTSGGSDDGTATSAVTTGPDETSGPDTFGTQGSTSDDSDSSRTEADEDSTSTAPSDESSSSDPLDSSTSGPPVGFQGCFLDEFDDQELDTGVWNKWDGPGTALEESADQTLRVTPAPHGIESTGIVTNHDYRFTFDDAWVRLRLAAEPLPSAPVNTYLQVLEGDSVLSIRMGRGVLSVSLSMPNGDGIREEFPEVGQPPWVGIRGEGTSVVFEMSNDGIEWTTLAVHEQPTVFERAKALVMVETVGDNPEQLPIEIGHLEGCIY